MAHALELPSEQTVLKSHPSLSFQKDGYRWTVERHGDLSTYTVSDGANELSLPIRYSFGLHSATFVLEHDGQLYESLVTYYAPAGGLDITLGDDAIPPHNLVEAIGRRLGDREATACFECHGSAPIAEGRPVLGSLVPGVHCEHCHSGAGQHLRDIQRGVISSIPKRLGELSAEDMSNFCGTCHRSWEDVIRIGARGPRNVRFQPYRLANSKCFNGTDNRIRCTACHDPHRPLERDESGYDKNCLACHAPARGAPSAGASAGGERRGFCPVATKRCVSCHMPRVKLPGSHQTFSDHEIRIVRLGDSYPD